MNTIQHIYSTGQISTGELLHWVESIVCDVFGIQVKLLERNRKQEVVFARTALFHILYNDFSMSFAEIKELCNRDRSSIHHLVTRSTVEIEINTIYKEKLQLCQEKLKK